MINNETARMINGYSVKQLREYLASIQDFQKKFPKRNLNELEQRVKNRIPTQMQKEYNQEQHMKTPYGGRRRRTRRNKKSKRTTRCRK